MKVLVIGAHGQIGQLLVKDLSDKGIDTLAAVRDLHQKDAFDGLPHVEAIFYDLKEQLEELSRIFKKYEPDAIVFTAGSGSTTGFDQTIMVDLDGAIKSIDAARDAGVKRFIMVSSYGADNREKWSESKLGPYLALKHYADEYLMSTKLNYTIFRPGNLTNDPGTGKVKLDPTDADKLQIPRADVAATIVCALQNDTTVRQTYTIVSGDTPISLLF